MPETSEKSYRISELAQQAGVHIETIRFYQRRGLLAIPHKPYGSIRYYNNAYLDKLKFIKSAKQLGFSLDEISDLLRLEDGSNCEAASLIAQQKLTFVQLKLNELKLIEHQLLTLVNRCQQQQKEQTACGLIHSLKAMPPYLTED